MPLKLVRNDLTLMQVDAIVNTANPEVAVGTGCDTAVYDAAGRDRLLAYRREHIGEAEEGTVFLTPGFDLPARYIIHAVSPRYIDGRSGEEEKIRACYRKSLALAKELGLDSVAFPMISTGSLRCPKPLGLRIALDEIYDFLLTEEMSVYLTLFDAESMRLGQKLYPDLEAYIDRNYVERRTEKEYSSDAGRRRGPMMLREECAAADPGIKCSRPEARAPRAPRPQSPKSLHLDIWKSEEPEIREPEACCSYEGGLSFEHQKKLSEKVSHLTDTFSQYLMYLIAQKGLENKEVYTAAAVDKKVFSKIKNNVAYQPKKQTALCLCIGARLNLDESKDLLCRAGYALSPCDKEDIIFSYFIEHEIYDIIELDIQLEEHGLPCMIE